MNEHNLPEDLVEWIRSRPESVQTSMRQFPPMCEVRAKPGVLLMAPAPGVVGTVVSWFENGNVRVEAPLRLGPLSQTSPITGHTLEHGDLVAAECQADQLEVVGYGEITPEMVEAVLAG